MCPIVVLPWLVGLVITIEGGLVVLQYMTFPQVVLWDLIKIREKFKLLINDCSGRVRSKTMLDPDYMQYDARYPRSLECPLPDPLAHSHPPLSRSPLFDSHNQNPSIWISDHSRHRSRNSDYLLPNYFLFNNPPLSSRCHRFLII